MTQALLTPHRTGSSAPAPATRRVLDLVSVFMNRLEERDPYGRQMQIRADQQPSDEQRGEMEARRQNLVGSLAPDQGSARKVVAALLVAFPAYGEQQDASTVLIGMYARAVGSFPTWAVQDAASRFLEARTRTAWDGSRCPTPPQLVAECRLSVRDAEDEIARLSKVLDADVYIVTQTPAEKAKFEAALKAATDAADMRKAGRRTVAEPEENPNTILDRFKAEGMGGKLLSDEALKLVGAKIPA